VAGANIGESAAIFEAVHGTAPDIAGRGVANPTAVMLAGAMMLERMGERDRAARLENAVREVIGAGQDLTPDLGGGGTTARFTERVMDAIQRHRRAPPAAR